MAARRRAASAEATVTALWPLPYLVEAVAC
jgi:hypothetical protein